MYRMHTDKSPHRDRRSCPSPRRQSWVFLAVRRNWLREFEPHRRLRHTAGLGLGNCASECLPHLMKCRPAAHRPRAGPCEGWAGWPGRRKKSSKSPTKNTTTKPFGQGTRGDVITGFGDGRHLEELQVDGQVFLGVLLDRLDQLVGRSQRGVGVVVERLVH